MIRPRFFKCIVIAFVATLLVLLGPGLPGSRFDAAPASSAPAAISAGPNFAASAATIYWTSPSNATGANDNNCASDSNYLSKDIIDLTNFSFSIPTASVITGIRVEPKAGYDGANYFSATLLKAGFPDGTTKTYLPVAAFAGCAETTFATLGGVGDVWGTGWSTSLINAANFGVRIIPAAADNLASLDAVRITVFFDPVTPAPTAFAILPRDVPEADTLLLFGTGLAGLAAYLAWQMRRIRTQRK